MRRIFLLTAAAALCAAQALEISGERIRAHVRFLASDLMEGRAPGTRGDALATGYIATELALAGAKPAGDNGTYFQTLPLVGVETQAGAQLSAAAKGKTVAFRYLDDFVGKTQRQKTLEQFDAEAVFAGHGIVAPEYGWNDYQGLDVRGKIVVLFTNEPPSDDPKFFAGRALTYYGRWTYKFEQAARMGALGAVIIHTTPTAGYGWGVVRTSWGREEPFVKLAPGARALAFAGWVSQEAGARLLALAGKKVDAMLKLADSRGFRPEPLGIRIRGRLPAKVRAFETRNVAAILPGSDPGRKSEAVIFSAHWDHLGVGPAVNGDSIYNGAVDNATGCGMILEIARAWAALEQKPRRSALFLALTSEEGGLLGSEFYAAHPIVPAASTAAALNFDGFYPFGRTSDVVTNGAERTTLYPLVEEAAERMSLTIKPDPRPEQGSYFRSDHFPFAKAGIPAFSIHMGDEFLGKPAGYGQKLFEEFNDKHYHQPSDEYSEDWDLSGIEQMTRFGFLLGISAANVEEMPVWKPGEGFRK